MTTAIEIGHDGTRTVFHRRRGMAWTHPVGERYRYWTRIRGSHWGWAVVPCDCPSEFTTNRLESLQDVGWPLERGFARRVAEPHPVGDAGGVA